MIVGAMSVIGLIDNFIRIIAEESGVWQFYLFRRQPYLARLFQFTFFTRDRDSFRIDFGRLLSDLSLRQGRF